MINQKTKQRELAYIVKIDNIKAIEKADRVELAAINGWQVMVKKDQFKIGDLAIYFEIDSKVPMTEQFMFLKDKHFKIKTQKYFKGTVLSQGLIMSLEEFPDMFEKDGDLWFFTSKYYKGKAVEVNDFLTKELKVTYAVDADNKRKTSNNKYENMKARHAKLFKQYKFINWLYQYSFGKHLLFFFLGKKKDNSGWPAWVVKTDEERVQNLPFLFPENNTKWMVTEKLDGTSTTFTLRHNKFYTCSRNVCFNTPERNDKCYYDTNVYLEMAQKYDIHNTLIKIANEMKKDRRYKHLDFITLQGETIGAGIQKRNYKMNNHDFYAFNLILGLKDGHTIRFNPLEMKTILDNYNIKSVPLINDNYSLPTTCDELLIYADGNSVLDNDLREGFVFRSIDGTQSFKAVSNAFLCKYKD